MLSSPFALLTPLDILFSIQPQNNEGGRWKKGFSGQIIGRPFQKSSALLFRFANDRVNLNFFENGWIFTLNYQRNKICR